MNIPIPTYNRSQNEEYYQDQLSQSLVQGLGDNGFQVTQQTNDNITTIADSAPSGTVLYNTTTDELQVIINGVVKTITVS